MTMTDSEPHAQVEKNGLDEFEQFMLSRAQGWMLVNKTGKLLSYQKIIPAQKANCLILGLLLFLAVVPGLLYLYFGHKSGKTYQLSVTMDASGTLIASGDPEGLAMYNNYLQVQQAKLTAETKVV